MTSLKPGYKTTELIVAVVMSLLAVLVNLGVLTAADSAAVGGAITEAVSAVVTLAIIGFNAWTYIRSRTELKREDMKSHPSTSITMGSTDIK